MAEPAGVESAILEKELAPQRRSPVAAPGTPGAGTSFAYGFGAVAYGIKDGGFKYFLLLFYAQVIGLDARLVSIALLVALVSDAFSDPIAGYWSDNFRSKWGRRHPFMYASALPVAVSYYFLWDPPSGWGQTQLFWYVLILSIVIRTFITFYETPSAALAPELTSDYDGRSKLLSWRYFFGWTGGNAMTVANFVLIFPLFATAAIPNGQFNPEAYSAYGLVASMLMFAAIMVSAIGTHGHIKRLPEAPPPRRLTLKTIFQEIFETLASRSFKALFGASLLGYIASGLSAGLAFYFSTYFWGFSSQQIGFITAGVFLSAVIGSTLAPWAGRRFGKKRGAISIGLIAFLGSPLPIFLRLIGVMPANGDPVLFPIILIATTIDVGLLIAYQILAASMIADLVEEAELKTHRRSEGLFFAATTFMRKCGEGGGIVLAGFIVTGAGLAAGAQQGQVPEDTLTRLGTVYVPTILALWLSMVAVISLYSLTREQHEENLRALKERNEVETKQSGP
jgi:Na+/melibiose symporter-like transporter